MSLRKLRLEGALEKVLRVMNLRRPQRESLEKIHQLFLRLDRDLRELNPLELVAKVRDAYPTWTFGSSYPEMTFALATGVGKTRLMGAIMAYLYLGRQSTNFLLLAPRSAILRKLEYESVPGSAKYIFVDPSIVPEPRLWHRGNLEVFDPNVAASELFERGPNLYVLSSQSIAGDDRRASRESEFTGASLLGHLKSLGDLVVMMDEAHHLGKVADRETKAWTQAIRDLSPRAQFGMTATPRQEEGVNVLHSYDLRTCLREKLYTKDVKIIVRQQSDSDKVSEDEWDRHTLDFALDRLRRKERALSEYRGATPFPSIQPVLLVCAETTEHAERVAAWLQSNRGLSNEEILVTHSERSKSEQDIERLVGIERSSSKIRVVVNVYELTEGWDVTNVYVIAPLRRMGTFQGAIQTMGRGLRLPAGTRVGDNDLDTLDILCFGRESLQEVLKTALHEYGDEEDADAFVQVRDAKDEQTRDEPTKTITIGAIKAIELKIPRATRKPIEPDLDFDVSASRHLAAKTAVEFNLAKGAVSGTAEGLKYDFDTFVRIAAARVIAGLRYLSDPIHRASVEKLVAVFVEGLGCKRGESISLDWTLVSEVIKEQIDSPYRKKESSFEIREEADVVSFKSYEWRVPETWEKPLKVSDVRQWNSSSYRLPISGWKRCIYAAPSFETEPEFRVSKILDTAADVLWWVRNDPPRLKIATPIGNYEPDLVALCRIAGAETLLNIEVKRGDFWHPPDSDARVKSLAADAWCDAVNRAKKGPKWGHWLVLDADVTEANSLQDLDRVRVNAPQGGST